MHVHDSELIYYIKCDEKCNKVILNMIRVEMDAARGN